MTTITTRKPTIIGTAGIVKNQIGEHIQEKKATAKGRLRRAISFLFSSGTDNPYNLPADMKAKLYL